MGRKKVVEKLRVYLGKDHVGTLVKQSNGAVEFRYSEEWLQSGYSISLSLPLADRFFTGEKAAFYFDNLLPDNKVILEAIARKVHADSTQQFDLLAAIGRECVGALSFFGIDEEPHFLNKMSVRPLSEANIAHRIRGLASDNPLGMDDGDFRLSLAGVQEKMALLYRKEKWYEPKGQTATSHILKKNMGTLAGGIDFKSSVDNEWICLALAQQAGIRTCHAEIVTFEDQRVLCVERFDRVWKDNFLYRIAQEDLCQALGFSPSKKYERSGGPSIETMMSVLMRSNNAEEDRKMFFKTAMFNDLLYNTDGHAKNFSLHVLRAGFALTPMYDLLSAHFLQRNHSERYKNLRSSLSVNNKFHYYEISLKDWAEEAKKVELENEVFEEICHELQEMTNHLKTDKKGFEQVDHVELEMIIQGIHLRARELFD